MARLLAVFSGLLGLLMIPLALNATTAWMLLVPAQLTFVSLTSAGAFVDGFDGRPEHARRWGLFALVVTGLVIAALEIGAEVRGARMGYWGGPWLCSLLTGWIPPTVAGVMGAAGVLRRRRLVRRSLRRRTRAA